MSMIARKAMLTALLLMAALILCGCGGGNSKPKEYVPGTYTGQSSEDEDGDYAIVTLTIGANNQITGVEFLTYEKNGDVKDEDYGMEGGVVANQDYYDKAQNAVRASQQYAKQYAETQDLSKIDAVSGATISYEQFKESVEIALSKAEK